MKASQDLPAPRRTPGAAEAARWAATLQEVADFKAEFGDLPGGRRTAREDLLRQWLRGQRVKAARGELSDDRIRALDHVDGDWRTNRTMLSWENRLTAAALEYQNTGQVPGTDSEAGMWLQRQRSRLSTGKLTADQLGALDGAIPGWRNLDYLTWARHANDLRLHMDRTGSLPTSRAKDPEVLRLYYWLARQRKRFRNGTMRDSQATKLDELIPGWRPAGS